MEHLCDEIIQLIIFELENPTSFALVSKRFHEVSKDPYVRAHYFLARHGQSHAMYWALGRGRVLTDRVIDILLSSGATISRYLIQVAIHHYFRTTSHPFIKTTWTRSIPFPVFAHFLKVAADLYGEIPLGKGEDDGSVFSSFLKESRLPVEMKSTKWEEIRDILEVYKFFPFHIKDNLMSQFPLALSIEPRLLPLAEANGFRMDSKYRDYVFRKMFEKQNHTLTAESRTEEIIQNVRELKRLDASMFLSRTVAAEVCMEAKANEAAYLALKKLDQSGDLLFELATLVEDLISLFIKTRSITTNGTIQIIRKLYSDFPSQEPTVRLVLLITVFLSSPSSGSERVSPSALKAKFEALGLAPLNKKDIFNILLNPFIEKYGPVIDYAKSVIGLPSKEVRELVEIVALRCLEVGCKGKMLKRLVEDFPMLKNTIADVVTTQYQLSLDDLPPWEDEKSCRKYRAKLSRDHALPQLAGLDDGLSIQSDFSDEEDSLRVDGMDITAEYSSSESSSDEEDELNESANSFAGGVDLGQIGQDALSVMIRQEESLNRFSSRRRPYYGYNYADMAGKLSYPADPLQVRKLIKDMYGIQSPVTAVFMTHAVVNDTLGIYLTYDAGTSSHVPITLQHFKILARLGRPVNWSMFHDIEMGAEFFFTAADYINKNTKSKVKAEVKTETSAPRLPSPPPLISRRASTSKLEKSPTKKRPRRSAAAIVTSYAIPDSDSDEEDLVNIDVDVGEYDEDHEFRLILNARQRKVESNMQRWIKELSILLKEEQKKYKEKKKAVDKSTPPDEPKVRVNKSDFFKSLSSNLRSLRKKDQDKRRALYGPDVANVDSSEDDDDEYQAKFTRRSKRRKIGN